MTPLWGVSTVFCPLLNLVAPGHTTAKRFSAVALESSFQCPHGSRFPFKQSTCRDHKAGFAGSAQALFKEPVSTEGLGLTEQA